MTQTIDYAQQSINVDLLLNNLRDMQSLRNLKPNDTSVYQLLLRCIYNADGVDSKEYKAALRAVFSLVGAEGGKKKETLTIKEIEQVLSLEVRLISPRVRSLLP